MTITRSKSIDAIRRFAGEDCEVAHVAPRGRELLARFSTLARLHYELVVEDKPGS